MDDKTRDGHCVRYWRKRKKLTIRDLAEKTGIAKSKISRIERGEQYLRASELVTMTEVFGIPVGTFYRAAEAEAA